MKQKLTLQEKLSKRKFKQTNRFFYWIYKFVMINFKSKKYNIHYEIIDDINKYDGPAIIVFNHLSRIDHTYVLGATYPRRFNMLAGYSEFFRSHLHFAFKHNNVLPKKQYITDIQGMKAMSTILSKKRGTIAFAPEGLCSNYGCNKPVVPGTGKMLKHYNVPVYFCELHGVYLQNTKVCLDERYGETYCRFSLLFSKEDLEKYSCQEIDDILNEKFRTDEYKWQKEKHIKWQTNGRICERLDDFLYKCPKCGSEFNMTAEKDYIKCNNCGNGATMDDYYDFHPYPGSIIPDTPLDWVEKERMDIIKEIRLDPNYKFVEEVKIGNLPKYEYVKNLDTSVITGEGILTIDHTGMHYEGTRYGESYKFDLDYNRLYTLITEKDASYFNLYINGEYFDIFPKRRTVGKIYLLVEEMHRYHVNYYKNFKWNDYMYEGMELGIDKKKS